MTATSIIFAAGQLGKALISKIQASNKVKILGVVPNEPNDINIQSTNVNILDVNQAKKTACSYILILHHNYLLNLHEFRTQAIFNIHGGILPNHRGHSSNIMAFLNFEPIGLTLHVVNDKMDDGKVLIVYPIEYNESDTYQSIQRKMRKTLSANISNIIDLCNNHIPTKNTPIRISNIVYSNKLRKSDGIIDFSMPGSSIERISKVFLHGTGMFLLKKEKLIKLSSLTFIPTDNYNKIRLIGAVVDNGKNTGIEPEYLISCLGGYLQITTKENLQIGTRFNGAKLYSH